MVSRGNVVGGVHIVRVDVANCRLDGCDNVGGGLNSSTSRRKGFHRGTYDVPNVNRVARSDTVESVDVVEIDIANRSINGCDNFGRGINGCSNGRKNINGSMYGIPKMNVIPGSDAVGRIDVVSIDVTHSSFNGCSNIGTSISESINRSGGFDRSVYDIPDVNIVARSDFIGSVDVVGINIAYCGLDGCNNIGVDVSDGFGRRKSIDRSVDNISDMDLVARCDVICGIDILGVNIGDGSLDRSDNIGSSIDNSSDRCESLNGSGYNVPSFLVPNGNGEHGGGKS